MIPHSRPTLDAEDAEAVVRVIESGQLARGPRLAAFEQAVARRLGRRAAVATSSGTAALTLALRALKVGPGDEVVLPAFACAALGHAVQAVGASAVLADVGDDLGLLPESAFRRLSGRTRAVIVVHPFGHPLDLRPFLEWEIPVIEDCAQALGASRQGRPVGSLGTVAVCSFYATKMVAAGEGGMLLADSPSLLAQARALGAGNAAPDSFNYRLSDLAAALGLVQLRRLEAFVARRRAIAERYDAAFAGTSVRTPPREADAEPCFSRYVVRVPEAARLIQGLRRRGIEAKRPVGDPLLLGDSDAAAYPGAARAFAECVSLPLYPSLTDGETESVIAAVAEALVEAGWQR